MNSPNKNSMSTTSYCCTHGEWRHLRHATRPVCPISCCSNAEKYLFIFFSASLGCLKILFDFNLKLMMSETNIFLMLISFNVVAARTRILHFVSTFDMKIPSWILPARRVNVSTVANFSYLFCSHLCWCDDFTCVCSVFFPLLQYFLASLSISTLCHECHHNMKTNANFNEFDYTILWYHTLTQCVSIEKKKIFHWRHQQH